MLPETLVLVPCVKKETRSKKNMTQNRWLKLLEINAYLCNTFGNYKSVVCN